MTFDPAVNNEKIFDECIEPLLAIILEVCRQHNIPTVMSFQYKEAGLYNCVMVDDGVDQRLMQVGQVLYPESFISVKPSTARA